MQTTFNESDVRYQALVAQASDGALTHLPIDAIEVKPNWNPRRFFDAAAMQALIDDIKLRGIVQPLVVRPNSEGDAFWLVAGERRLRAATVAGLETVPVIVRAVSETDAAAMATAENMVRDDMSAAEESRVAHRIVSLCDGDRSEAAKTLGWSRGKLDSRMALLNCADAVLDALQERRLAIGHAELLAGIPKALQEQSLPGILDQDMSVNALAETIGRYAYELSSACFDTGDCGGCKNNSGSVVDLFETRIDEGRCMNRECFHAKTQAFLDARKAELAEHYPVIWLDTEKDEASRVFLQREGARGVGKNQYAACQSCGSYGAILRTQPGHEGEIETGVCFDKDCNNNKVMAYRSAVVASPTQAVESGASQTPSATVAKGKKADARSQAEPNELPLRVRDFIRDTHCKAVTEEVGKDRKLVKVVSAWALATNGVLGERGKAALKAHGVSATRLSRDAWFERLLTLDDEALDRLLADLAASVAGESGHRIGDELKAAKVLLQACASDMAKHFMVNRAYLDTLTVSAIHELLRESKFNEWYDGQHGKGASKGFIKGKTRGALIDGVVASKFSWEGFVPKVFAL